MENIPSFILDLLQYKSFEELTASEQQEVTRHLSAGEYTELYAASAAAKSFIQLENKTCIGPTRKDALIDRFRQKHERVSPFKLILNKPVEMWKVASIILLLGFGGTLLMMQVKGASQVKYITELDTVYLEKEMPVTKVYDTVYLTREVERGSRPSARRGDEVQSQFTRSNALPQLPPEEYGEINMMSIHEKDRPLNNKKGSSIKDDSLINSFEFTRL